MIDAYTPISAVLPEGIWPDALAQKDGGTFLDKVACVIYDERADDIEFHVFIRGKVMTEARISLPLLQGMELVFGKGDSDETGLIDVEFTLAGQEDGPPIFELKVVTTTLSLTLSRDLFVPVEIAEVNGQLQVTPQPGNVAIPLPFALLVLFDGNDWTIDFEVPAGVGTGLTLPLCALGDSGVVIEATDLELNFSGNGTRPAGASAGWKGLYLGSLRLYLPQLFNGHISATGLGIGTGGLWGELAASFMLNYSATSTPHFTGDLATPLFGIEGGLREVSLSFMQSIPTTFDIKGALLLPFFDEPVEVDIGIDIDGRFSVRLTSVGPNGLYKLTKPGILEMELDSIGFEVKDGVFLAKLSGQITPLVGRDKGLDWPAFKVEELSIDSKGNVNLQGGWLPLREQYNLDFFNFHIGITKLGFGKTDDGGKFIAVSGSLKLVDGLTAGASVEGLRVTWYDDGSDPKISFNGIGVEFEIPEVMYFKGDVAYQELRENGELVHRFDGDIKLQLHAADLEIDGKVMFGSASGGPQGKYNFFAIFLETELPTGIALGPTPLNLYALAGLFALQLAPNKAPNEEWYAGWYKRPVEGVIDWQSKWTPIRGSMAFGVGATIGTAADNGFTFACKALLVIVFPGPIFLLEGKANLLKKRAELDGPGEPQFRSLAVLDMRQGQILIGLDAKYKHHANGEIINITAGAEAFFHKPDDWHIYMGVREPREKRIRATILKLFEANAYFMIDPKQLAMGAWVGYAKRWKFGPVSLALEAWLEGNVAVNWTPLHFHGDLWLHGNVEVKVFGFGFGLSVDARFAADVFKPYHVKASIEVSLRLRKPLKPKHVQITLEWGPKKDWPTYLPLPLQEVAIGHFKVTTSWSLSRNGTPPLLGPKYDFDEAGLRGYVDPNPEDFTEPGIDVLPVVPLDCRVQISFGRNVHDDAFVGVNPQLVQPAYERLGNTAADVGPVKVRYSLKQIELGKWDRQAQKWQTVAVTDPPPYSGARTLFGSWAAVPQLPSGAGQTSGANTKLWLWSITPFDYTRFSGSDGDDWFTANFPNYPCVPQDIPDREVCCDFERLDRSQSLQTPWQSPEHPEITLSWQSRAQQRVKVLDPPVSGFTRALCFPVVASNLEPISSSDGIPPEEVSPAFSRDELAQVPGPEQPSVVSLGVGADSPEFVPPIPVTISLSAPAKRVKLLIIEKKKTTDVCLDFRNREQVQVNLPLIEQGVSIGSGGVTTILSVPTTLGTLTGLRCNVVAPGIPPGIMNITLPCAAATVELMLSYVTALASPQDSTESIEAPIPPDATVSVAAFNANGEQLAVKSMLNPQHQPEIIRFEGKDIRQIRISFPQSPTFLHKLCFVCPDIAPSVTATGFDAAGRPTIVFENQGNEVEVSGENLVRVQVNGKGEICLLKICALFGPDPLEVDHRQEMAAHLANEVARWQDAGEVLEPFSAYQLTIVTGIDAYGEGELSGSRHLTQTEHAFFRTEGPPGLTKLSLPPGRDANEADKFDSGLEDLTRYVRQTTPATVPAMGEKPVMAKPFYRAYDIGVDFNENYVDLMYRISGRDLGLYLYDSNNRPALGPDGQLLIQSGDWGTVEELTLTEGEQRWLALSNAKDRCLPVISMETIAHDKKLTSAVAGRVLAPDMIYEARLIPLLLREGFLGYLVGTVAQGPSGKLGRWEVHDEGTVNAPSKWEVRQVAATSSRYLTQTSNIKGDNDDASDPVKPGTILLFGNDPALDAEPNEQPFNWTDYRLSVYLSAAGDGAIGVVFRYQDSDNYCRLSLDRKEKCRRLVSVAGGNHKILQQDDFTYEPQHDYLITIEAIANALRVYQDGVLIFAVTDVALLNGSIGLYCYDNAGARFNDVRVDDFRQTAPVVYRFPFTTSLFANFFHHLHSYQDETWRIAVENVPNARAALAKAVVQNTPPTDGEARAYETLATAILGPAARQNPPEVQVTRVEIDGAPLAFLVQSPEPTGWLRTDIDLWRTNLARTEPALPGKVKLAAVNFAANRIDIDSIVLLLREPMNLTGYRIESRLVTWPVSPQSGVVIDAQTLSGDTFAGQAWATYRTFDAEKNLAAGTILQIKPDDSMPSPAELVGLDASSVVPARRIFYSVESRLVAPDGKIIHARHFLPDGDYFPEDVSVLRKADGTCFFMVKLDGGLSGIPFSLSQYRLNLTYHRDNRARVSTSQILSQAGDQADEFVTLDIPLQTQ